MENETKEVKIPPKIEEDIENEERKATEYTVNEVLFNNFDPYYIFFLLVNKIY